MSAVVLVAECPAGQADLDRLHTLAERLGRLPGGVRQPAANVWIIDVETSLDFLLKFPKIAEQVGQKFQGLTIASKPPVGS